MGRPEPVRPKEPLTAVHELELILGLLAVVAILATAARRLGIPYPILLVLGGLGLGFVPGLPHVELAPEAVFLLFLPPILFSAAYFTDWRAFVANRRPISLLAVGLVLTTTVAVAVVAHAVVDGMTWPVAFLLGAIVSPPDAVATVAIIQRLGIPRRLVTIMEGESLVNDATALVAYRFAVAAVVTGSFSLWEAGLKFVLVAVGGVLIGLVVGWVLVQILTRLHDPPVEITATLLAPVAAYLPAEELGVSGVLATVTAGIYLGRRGSALVPAVSRLRAVAVWEVVIFLVNGLVFILIGLQLPTVLETVGDRPLGELLWAAAAISLVTIVVRLAWVYPATYLPRIMVPGLRERDPAPSWQYPAVLGWAGLRGVVSLAAALALPFETDIGVPFPERDLVIFLTFCVILVTLVGQGLTLAPLIRRLGLAADDDEREEALARREGALAAIARIDELAAEPWVPVESAETLRARYEHRLEHFPASLDPADLDGDHVTAHERLRLDVLAAERRAVIVLRDRGRIGDEALRRVEYDLDLAEERSEE